MKIQKNYSSKSWENMSEYSLQELISLQLLNNIDQISSQIRLLEQKLQDKQVI